MGGVVRVPTPAAPSCTGTPLPEHQQFVCMCTVSPLPPAVPSPSPPRRPSLLPHSCSSRLPLPLSLPLSPPRRPLWSRRRSRTSSGCRCAPPYPAQPRPATPLHDPTPARLTPHPRPLTPRVAARQCAVRRGRGGGGNGRARGGGARHCEAARERHKQRAPRGTREGEAVEALETFSGAFWGLENVVGVSFPGFGRLATLA